MYGTARPHWREREIELCEAGPLDISSVHWSIERLPVVNTFTVYVDV